MQIIDYPCKISAESYSKLMRKIVSELPKVSDPISIYQLGSVNDPGISDLDILCIFKDNTKCSFNINNSLNETERKILTHHLFGITESDKELSLKYNHFTNFKLVYGKDLAIDKNAATSNELKTQIALEFMLKFFISLDIQIKYSTIKIRSFLLSAKALLYDVELLELSGCKLESMITQVMAWRNNWFKHRPSAAEITSFVRKFHSELMSVLESQLECNMFFLPEDKVKISNNISIIKADKLNAKHKGFTFPTVFSSLGKRYFNLQNKFNEFIYEIPIQHCEKDNIIHQRFEFYKKTIIYNQDNLPNFMPLTTGLRLFYN
jgi:hypothetical protein